MKTTEKSTCRRGAPNMACLPASNDGDNPQKKERGAPLLAAAGAINGCSPARGIQSRFSNMDPARGEQNEQRHPTLTSGSADCGTRAANGHRRHASRLPDACDAEARGSASGSNVCVDSGASSASGRANSEGTCDAGNVRHARWRYSATLTKATNGNLPLHMRSRWVVVLSIGSSQAKGAHPFGLYDGSSYTTITRTGRRNGNENGVCWHQVPGNLRICRCGRTHRALPEPDCRRAPCLAFDPAARPNAADNCPPRSISRCSAETAERSSCGRSASVRNRERPESRFVWDWAARLARSAAACSIAGSSQRAIRLRISNPRLGFGSGQLRPDGLPVVGPQVLQAGQRINLVVLASKRRTGNPQAAHHLVQVLLINFEQCSDLATPLRGVCGKCHPTESSDSLAYVKLMASIFS